MEFDFAVIGSGFGGSVSALRLAEKGYSVVVLEKGKWVTPPDMEDASKSLSKLIWNPALGMRGFFTYDFFRHVSIVGGVGEALVDHYSARRLRTAGQAGIRQIDGVCSFDHCRFRPNALDDSIVDCNVSRRINARRILAVRCDPAISGGYCAASTIRCYGCAMTA